MTCLGCRAENPNGKKFCGECGATLEKPASVAVVGEDGAWHCAKHPKVVTRYTPAGTRCRACAKNKIALRPAGVLHSAVGGVEGASPMGRRVWYLALWYFVISFLRNPFGW